MRKLPCPRCHRPTITLGQRLTATSAHYPARCSHCGARVVAEPSCDWGFAVEPVGYLLCGLLYLLTRDGLLALQIGLTVLVVAWPVVFWRTPLRELPEPADYPPELGVQSGPDDAVVGPVMAGVLHLLLYLAVVALTLWLWS